MGSASIAAAAGQLLAVGTVLANRYEILQTLGQGGMGAVYKVHDRELDRYAALKTIRPELASYPEMLQRFKQELILARQVAHRNVVRLYDISEDGGVKFITMEYIDGEDFRSILRREGKFTPEAAIEIIRQICYALEAAHAEGVIHRDLKPQNILRDKQGRIVVMDFGLARAVESNGMTQTGALLGTMDYMSPEQAKGESVDCTSDIYTAGLIFYELLTGKMPFAADSALASLMKRAQQRAIPASEIDNSVPRNLSTIVGHCIDPDRKKRYQSATEILADLEVVSPGPKTSISSMMPRRGYASPVYKWVVIGFLGAVLLGGAGYAGWKKIFSHPAVVNHAPVSVLVADFENHTGDPVFDGTLEPMFNAALEGASFINAFSRGEAHKLAAQLPNHPDNKIDEQSARLIATSQSLGAIVTGSLSRRGDGYKISIEAMNGLSGNSIATAEATVANKDDVMLEIPKLAAPIREALGDTTPESVQLAQSQGSFKVSSLEAAHQYGVGMEQQFAGKWNEAVQAFGKAAELDPDFGRAYSGLAASYRNIGRDDEAQNDFKLALQHVDRMTERERFRTRGAYYFFIGDYGKCIEEYGSLVAQYPADNIGHSNLANCYMRLRNMPKALEEVKRAVEVSPKGVVQRCNLSLLYTYNGDFASGEREAREVLKMNPAYEPAYMTLADAQIGLGNAQMATETYRSLAKLGKSSASTATLGLAAVAGYQGRFSEAAHMLRSGADADLAAKDTDSAGDTLIAMAVAQLASGHNKEAIDLASRAVASKKDVNIRFVAGRVFAEAGASDKAREISTGLAAESHIEPQTYAKIIDGLIAIQGKNTQGAIQLLSEANKSLDTWIGHFDLGRAYVEAGQFTEANSEFDICIKRKGESIEFLDDGPTYSYLPPVFYYQGRALQGLRSHGFSDSLQTYVTIRGESKDDPLAADALHQLTVAQ
jgi:tetratricopeptide (TPR) repeat protein/predicted Ser/Thr protein kinase